MLNDAAHKAPLGELVDIMDVGFACAYLATPFAKRITGPAEPFTWTAEQTLSRDRRPPPIYNGAP